MLTHNNFTEITGLCIAKRIGTLKRTFVLLLLLITGFNSAFGGIQEGELPPKFILIHLDAVSSYQLMSEMEAGNLPNIKNTFYPDGYIPYSITYFPSKTPVVISSLRYGIPPEFSELAGWATIDSETGKSYSGFTSFRKMVLSKSRLAMTNTLYGIPLLDRFAGLALINLPDLLEKYRVLEFYWYAVDSYGHFYGEESYLKKLQVFDKHLGRLMRKLDNDVNIAIYADHGMVFGQGVETKDEIKEAIGDMVKMVSYPNLYINSAEKTPKIAREVVKKTNIDFAFYKSCENRVEGFHKDGIMQFNYEDDRIRYTFQGEDPLEYYETGYQGEDLTINQWLELTHELKYPVTPVKLFNFFSNPRSGDILTLMEPDKYSQSSYTRSGNHGGFTYQDLIIPILFSGPDVDFLQGRQTMWLSNLFHEIEGIDFYHRPARDDHYLEAWTNVETLRNYNRVSISPYYRWRIGADISYIDPFSIDHHQIWGKFDLLRSYLTRLWIGGGANFESGDTSPMGFIRHEFRYRRFQTRSTLSTTGNHTFALEFRVLSPLYLQVVNFNSVGLRLHF